MSNKKKIEKTEVEEQAVVADVSEKTVGGTEAVEAATEKPSAFRARNVEKMIEAIVEQGKKNG